MQNQMNKYRRLKNLFLRQSYLDAWEDYQRSILKKSFPKWDYIVLTASNEEQGKAFQKQIEYRILCRSAHLTDAAFLSGNSRSGWKTDWFRWRNAACFADAF